MNSYIFGNPYGEEGTIKSNLGYSVLAHAWMSISFTKPRTNPTKNNLFKKVNYNILYARTKDNIVVIGSVPNKDKLISFQNTIFNGSLKINPIEGERLEKRVSKMLLLKEDYYNEAIFLDWNNIKEVSVEDLPKSIKRKQIHWNF